MTKHKQDKPQPEVLQEYIRIKEEHKEQYERKKASQAQARNRRQQLRDLKEDREYN